MPELPELEALRIRLGPRLEGRLITAATVWFAMNVLVAPYSARLRQDIRDVGSLLR